MTCRTTAEAVWPQSVRVMYLRANKTENYLANFCFRFLFLNSSFCCCCERRKRRKKPSKKYGTSTHHRQSSPQRLLVKGIKCDCAVLCLCCYCCWAGHCVFSIERASSIFGKFFCHDSMNIEVIDHNMNIICL